MESLVLHVKKYIYSDREQWFCCAEGSHQGLDSWGRTEEEALGGSLLGIKVCWPNELPYIKDVIIHEEGVVMPDGVK